MDELVIPETWELLDDGTWRAWNIDGRLVGGRLGQRLSDRHVGWHGYELVVRRPDGSDEVRLAMDDWCRPESGDVRADLIEALRQVAPDLVDLTDELLASPPVHDYARDLYSAHRAAVEAAAAAARAAAEEARREAVERAERMRPHYGWDGDDLVVRVDGEVVARIAPDRWQGEHGDRFNRLIRQLHQAGRYEMERRDLIAMVRAHEAPVDPIAESLRAVRAASSELKAGLERARRAYSSQTTVA
jgi:hypothetical protein